ncbi:hypothetical protein [Desulfobulbus propionicus]|uniref:hypothetical protein n=1 Tax=Desulfobulbus propionicus TaxID=894 RepID=UPI00146DDC76|nr:hypothetical protein [Desulfobulbus propionicus]
MTTAPDQQEGSNEARTEDGIASYTANCITNKEPRLFQRYPGTTPFNRMASRAVSFPY